MNVLYCTSDNKENLEWNCSEWRCALPAATLNVYPGNSAHLLSIIEFASMTTKAMQLCENHDVIVLQRNIVGPVLTAMEYWKSRGKIIIIDVDDDYAHMPPDVMSYNYWILGEIVNPANKKVYKLAQTPVEQLRWGIKLAHAVTVPSKVLQKDWKPYNPNTLLVPNYLDFSRYENLWKETYNPVTIGWGGSLSHYTSFQLSGIIVALNRIMENNKSIKLVIMGDRAIYDAIKVEYPRKKFITWGPIRDWPSNCAENIDIGLAPLFGEYDKRRSWIKPLEYMAMGIPCIASDFPAYEDLRENIVLTENGPKNWEHQIQSVLDNFSHHKQRAIENIEVARTYDYHNHTNELIETYTRIKEMYQ